MPLIILFITLIQIKMKKIFLSVALVAIVFLQHSYAQDSNKQTQLTQLLQSYYDIKNALVNSNATAAASKAGEFQNAINSIDMKALSEPDMNAFMSLQSKLTGDAKLISETKDIAKQRTYFSNLSSNFYTLAKAVKLSEAPAYYAYCPMKKSYWLSNEASIKNPYFGNAMLTCGKVTDTLK